MGSKAEYGPITVSILVIIGFLSCVGAVVFGVAVEDSELMFILIGALAAAFQNVVSYWIGSSRGSKEKTDLLTKDRTPSRS